LWDSFPPGRRADPEAVTAVLAAAAGYFVYQEGCVGDAWRAADPG
jgi:hypothetical protein